MRTITCTACKSVNGYEAETCAKCGEPLAMAKLHDAMDGIRETTSRFQHQQAVHSRGGFSSINGFGTMLLDYRPRGDGTWDAVRWVTAAGIPLVPLGAYLIQPIYQDYTYGRHTASFTVLERPPLAAQRVLRTYLLLVAGLLPLALGLMTDWVERTVGNGPAGFFVILACGIWAAWIVFMRIKNDGKVYKPLPPRRVAA